MTPSPRTVVRRQELGHALDRVSGGLDSGPITGGMVRVWSQSGSPLRLEAGTDQRVQTECPGDAVDLDLVVDHAQLSQLVRSLSVDAVILREEGYNMVVSAGSGQWHVPGVDTESWSPDRLVYDPATFAVPGSVIAQAAKLAFACSREEHRRSMRCIGVRLSEDHVELTATDGNVFVRRTIAGTVANAPEGVIPIPVEIFDAAARLVRSADDQVRVDLAAKTIRLTGPHGTLIAATVDEKFPPVDRIIPSGEITATARVNRDQLIAALQRTGRFSAAVNQCIQIDFDPSAGLTLSAQAESGRGSEILEEAEVTGHGANRMNWKKLVPVLKAIDAVEVDLDLRHRDAPMMMVPVSDGERDESGLNGIAPIVWID